MTTDVGLTVYETGLLQSIEDHDLQVIHVFDPHGVEVAFSYSAGLPISVGQPDVIIFGLPKDLMHFMINEVAKRCGDGLTLSDGCVLDGLIEDYPCVVRQVSSENVVAEYFNSAMWVHQRAFGTPMEKAFQVVWPGKTRGLFPWDIGCNDAVMAAQPPLYQSRTNL